MLELINHIFSTPFIWPSLGMITSIGMFIGPLLYNGDLKAVYKALVSVGVFAFFLVIIMQSHILHVENKEWPCSLQPLIFVTLVGVSYVLGLLIGIYIFRKAHKISRKH